MPSSYTCRKERGFTFRARSAFTLRDTSSAVLALGLLLGVGAVAADSIRRTGGLGGSISNLRARGDGIASFARDHNDWFPAYSWNETNFDTPFADLQAEAQQGGVRASAAQAIHILRTRTGDDSIPVISGFVPQIQYTDLVLLDYLGEEFPSRLVASPGDENLLGWQDGQPVPNPDTPSGRLFLYRSSYETPPTYWQPEELVSPGERVRQGSTHSSYFLSTQAAFQPRQLGTIAYPSQVVSSYETAQRFFGPREVAWMFEEARLPLLMADGSVVVRTTREANRGWNPANPTFRTPTTISYAPFEFEPPNPSGEPSTRHFGRYRWTRGGALGRAFGDEIDTGQ